MVQCKLKETLIDHPFWRSEEQKEVTKTIPEMIKDILQFKKTWDDLQKEIKNEKRAYVEKQLKDIEIAFFVSIQVEEGIGMGTQEEGSGEQLQKDKVREDTEKIIESMKKVELEEKQAKRFEYKRTQSVETILHKYDKRKKKHHKPAAKNEEELINLYKARKYLKQLVEFEKNDEKFSQLLALNTIRDTHEILMENLLDGKSGQPGHFSECKRFGSFEGEKHSYPYIPKKQVTEDVLTALVDCYNSSVEKQKKEIMNELNAATLQKIFQSAAKFLFIFLQLHPFPDGNGRLGRLLCSYFLELICPFPSSIYNVYSPTEKSDYVKVLLDARKGIDFDVTLNNKEEGIEFFGKLYDHDESAMTSLIIESNWFSWKKFIDVIKVKFKDEYDRCCSIM